MDLNPDENFLGKEDLPGKILLITVCRGLLDINPESNMIHLVHYIT
jgi:hypothetical protein